MDFKSRGLTVDTGRYNEVLFGSFILGKLIQMEDVYDWKFGMERREDFPAFDDVVVGIRPKKEDEMHYYAFQLKGCDGKQKRFGPHALFHELAPPNATNRPKELLLTKFYEEILSKIKSEESAKAINRVNNFVIFTQYKFEKQNSYGDSFIKALQEGSNGSEYGTLLSLLPQISGTPNQVLKINPSKIKNTILNWFPQNSECVLEAERFLKKVLIIASTPRPEKINQLGSQMFMKWELMKSKVHDVRYGTFGDTMGSSSKDSNKAKNWITKKKLLKIKVNFQGAAISIGSVLNKVDPSTLFQLLIAPEEIIIGKELKGPDEAFHIMRQFKLSGSPEVKLEHDLLNERVVIITGGPGKGKTETLKHAAESLKKKDGSKVWVIELRIADLARVFERHKINELPILTIVQDLWKILTEMAVPEMENDELTRKCFQMTLKGELNDVTVGVFMDGLDEVGSKYYDLTLILILLLTQLSSVTSLWISTRTILQAQLESLFNIKSHTMTSFNKYEQKFFLRRKWNVTRSDLLRFEYFSERFLQELEYYIASLIGIPLFTRMITEIYEDRYRMDSMADDKMSLIYLLEELIDKMFQWQHMKYFQIQVTNEASLKGLKEREKYMFISEHTLMALHDLFEPIPGIGHILNEQDYVKVQELLKRVTEPGQFISGIVENSPDQKLTFIHNQFAGYFAARWLFDTLSMLQAEMKSFQIPSRDAAAFREIHLKRYQLTNLNDGLSLNRLDEVEAFLQKFLMDDSNFNVRLLFLDMAVKDCPFKYDFLQQCLHDERINVPDLMISNSPGGLNIQPFHIALMTRRMNPYFVDIPLLSDELRHNPWTFILKNEILRLGNISGNRGRPSLLHSYLEGDIVSDSHLPGPFPKSNSLLTGHGVHVNKTDRLSERWPPHEARMMDDLSIAERLIREDWRPCSGIIREARANISQVDEIGAFPVQKASASDLSGANSRVIGMEAAEWYADEEDDYSDPENVEHFESADAENNEEYEHDSSENYRSESGDLEEHNSENGDSEEDTSETGDSEEVNSEASGSEDDPEEYDED